MEGEREEEENSFSKERWRDSYMFPLQEEGTWGGKVLASTCKDATKKVQGQGETNDCYNSSTRLGIRFRWWN